jgi:hypothetical protein
MMKQHKKPELRIKRTIQFASAIILAIAPWFFANARSPKKKELRVKQSQEYIVTCKMTLDFDSIEECKRGSVIREIAQTQYWIRLPSDSAKECLDAVRKRNCATQPNFKYRGIKVKGNGVSFI